MHMYPRHGLAPTLAAGVVRAGTWWAEDTGGTLLLCPIVNGMETREESVWTWQSRKISLKMWNWQSNLISSASSHNGVTGTRFAPHAPPPASDWKT